MWFKEPRPANYILPSIAIPDVMASSVDIQRHPSKDKQTRSCSPSKASPDNPNARRRSRSPSRRQHYHRHDSPRVKRKRSLSSMVAPLPFNARALSKRDLSEYKPMFALYLDIQKHLVLDDISAAEIKGRWKSFTSKWYEPFLHRRF